MSHILRKTVIASVIGFSSMIRAQFALPTFQAAQARQNVVYSNFALDFDGVNDYVSTGGSNVGKPCTVEAWTKKTSNSGHGTLLSGGSYRVRLDQWSTSNKVGFTKTGSYDASFDKSTTLNEWVHVAIVFTSDSSTLFINGAYHSKHNQTTFNLPTSSIGTGGSSTITATIDELRIWNDARTAAEIADNMEMELAGDEANLVAYYKMSDGSGTTLTDNSSNSNTGTLTNMVTSGGSSDWVASYAPIGTFNSSYKTDVEAIWQNTGTNASSSSNGLYMTVGSALTEQNWAAYGNNNTTGTSTSDLPDGVALRSGRIWQVDEEGTVTPTLTIDVDESTVLSIFAHGATANKLLYRSGTSGDFSIGAEGSSTNRSDKTVSFSSGVDVSGVGLDSGYFYTLGVTSSFLSDGTHGSTDWAKGADFDGIIDRAYQHAEDSATENPLHRSSNGDGKAWTVSALFNYNDVAGRTVWQQGACNDYDVAMEATNVSGLTFAYGEEGSDRLTFTNSDIGPYTWYSITVAFNGGTTGYTNYGLSFDGHDDRVSLPNSVNMGTSDFTISLRLKTDDLDTRQHVFQQTGGSGNRVIAINTDGSLTSRLGGTGSDHDSGADLSADTWYHIVLVHDNSANTIKWYVDGTEKNTNTSVDIPSNGSSYYLGINANANDKMFDGEMDELRIWNAALTSIPGHSGTDSILVGSESNLVAYYRFDEYDGTTIEDLTSNNHHGTTQQMTGDHRTASGVTLAPLDSLDDYYGRFSFYTTNISTGAVSSLSMTTANTNYGYTGAAGGTFTVAARGCNSFVLNSQFAYVGITNSALSSSAIQGNGSYVTGFALDPVGWADANFSLPDATASNTTKIWLFGDGDNDTEQYVYNYINPSDTDSRLNKEGDRLEINVYIAN